MNAHIARSLIAVFASSVAASACGDRPGIEAGDRFVTRDSAGIELVTNDHADRPLGLSLALRFGVVDGDPDLQFSRVRAVAVDGSGGIWVVDSHETVRHYDSTGVYRGSVGGAGRGPGEARGYAHVWLARDQLIAWGYPSILQQFRTTGELLASRAAITDDGSQLHPLGFGGERWFFSAQSYRSAGAAVFRPSVRILAAADLPDIPDTVGVFAGDLFRRAPGGEAARASYFFGNPHFAVDRAGNLFVSDTLRYQVVVHRDDGRPFRIIRRSAPSTPYDPAWRGDIVEGATLALRRDRDQPVDRDARDRVVAGILTPDPPPQLPFIGRLLVAPGGELWIERADRHPRPGMGAVAHAFGYVRHAWRPEWKAPQVYDLFDARGGYRGTVRVQQDFEPMSATAQRLYGVLYDELGVEYVAAYELAGVE